MMLIILCFLTTCQALKYEVLAIISSFSPQNSPVSEICCYHADYRFVKSELVRG